MKGNGRPPPPSPHERVKFPARGLLGGHSGRPVGVLINDALPPFYKGTMEFQPGDVAISEAAGGGGFFPPEERDPERVLKDVVDGYVSLEKAEEVYRVAIRGGGRE